MKIEIPEFIDGEIKELMRTYFGRPSGLISELFDLIVLETHDASVNYLNGHISLKEFDEINKLMGKRLDWLDENLTSLVHIINQLEEEYNASTLRK